MCAVCCLVVARCSLVFALCYCHPVRSLLCGIGFGGFVRCCLCFVVVYYCALLNCGCVLLVVCCCSLFAVCCLLFVRCLLCLRFVVCCACGLLFVDSGSLLVE